MPISWGSGGAGTTSTEAERGSARELFRDLSEVFVSERRRKARDPREQVIRPEVFRHARHVEEARRLEYALLVEDERDPPGAFVDVIVTVTARRSPRGRALGAVQARKPLVRDADLRLGLQSFPVADLLGCNGERFEKRRWPLVGAALGVKPVGRFTLAEGVRPLLAEAEFLRGDGLTAPAAFRAPRRRGLDHMRHRSSQA